MITSLKENEIFVYGSNLAGVNAGGAARYAEKHFGAVGGIGEGLNGWNVARCYAFPTLGWDLEKRTDEELNTSRDLFFACAALHPNHTFLMTPVGTGIAGYDPEYMKQLFKNPPANVVLPDEWILP